MNDLLTVAAHGAALPDDAIRALAASAATEVLCAAARARRDAVHGALVTYSPKVFIPLTRLCRDTCRYCTFAEAPRRGAAAYLSPEEVLAIARAGAAAGCHEALFTLGDQPERRWKEARDELARLGHPTTLVLSRRHGAAGAGGNRAAAARQSRRDDGGATWRCCAPSPSRRA